MPSRGRGEWHASVGATETVKRLAPVNADDDELKSTAGIAGPRDAGETKPSLPECGIAKKDRSPPVDQPPEVAERQASAGARDGVKGKGAISLRALRCMR